MASITSRARQIFSSVVPGGLFPKTTGSKAVGVVIFVLASFAIGWIVRGSLRGRATNGKVEKKETPDSTPTSTSPSGDTPGGKVEKKGTPDPTPGATSPSGATPSGKVEKAETPDPTPASTSPSGDTPKSEIKKIIYVITPTETTQIYVTWQKHSGSNRSFRSQLKAMTRINDSNRWEIGVTPEEAVDLKFYVLGDASSTKDKLKITYGTYDLKQGESVETTRPRATYESDVRLKVIDDPSKETASALTSSSSTPSPTASAKRILKVSKDVGYRNTLFCNEKPMTNDGTNVGWFIEIDGANVPTEPVFSINDSGEKFKLEFTILDPSKSTPNQ